MITSAQLTINDTTPTLLATGGKGGTRVYPGSNVPNGNGFYIGGSASLSASDGVLQGWPGVSNAYFFDIAQGDSLYALLPPGTGPLLMFVLAISLP